MLEREPGGETKGPGLAEPHERGERISVQLGTPATPAPRPQPVVPPLAVRLFHFAFRPESWAEALKLPLRYILMPLFVAILIAAALAGTGFAIRLHRGLEAFAAGYDAHYPALILKDGKLGLVDPNAQANPIRISAAGGDVIIDPAGKTTVEDLREKGGILMTDAVVYQEVMGLQHQVPLKEHPAFAALADGTVIDGAFLKSTLAQRGAGIVGVFGLLVALLTALGEIVWSLVMVVIVAPVVVIAAAALRMRHRTAARASAAVLVPLVLLGGVLSLLGVSPTQTLRPEYVPFFWFVATVLLGCWAAVLATRMYRPRRQARNL